MGFQHWRLINSVQAKKLLNPGGLFLNYYFFGGGSRGCLIRRGLDGSRQTAKQASTASLLPHPFSAAGRGRAQLLLVDDCSAICSGILIYFDNPWNWECSS